MVFLNLHLNSSFVCSSSILFYVFDFLKVWWWPWMRGENQVTSHRLKKQRAHRQYASVTVVHCNLSRYLLWGKFPFYASSIKTSSLLWTHLDKRSGAKTIFPVFHLKQKHWTKIYINNLWYKFFHGKYMIWHSVIILWSLCTPFKHCIIFSQDRVRIRKVIKVMALVFGMLPYIQDIAFK